MYLKQARDRRHDAKRRQEKPWRAWYKSKRWLQLRTQQLFEHPLCVMCLAAGRIVSATVCDHVERHMGDPVLFWEGPRQSLCAPHHNSTKQREERAEGARVIGLDGWPIEVVPKRWGFSIPHGVQPSGIPVHLVCGPPGSGKSTYARARAHPTDIIIDFDDILECLGYDRYTQDILHYRIAMKRRDIEINRLSKLETGKAWLIVSAPTLAERNAWVSALGNVRVHSMDTDERMCKQRIEKRGVNVHALSASVDLYHIAKERELNTHSMRKLE